MNVRREREQEFIDTAASPIYPVRSAISCYLNNNRGEALKFRKLANEITSINLRESEPCTAQHTHTGPHLSAHLARNAEKGISIRKHEIRIHCKIGL